MGRVTEGKVPCSYPQKKSAAEVFPRPTFYVVLVAEGSFGLSGDGEGTVVKQEAGRGDLGSDVGP